MVQLLPKELEHSCIKCIIFTYHIGILNSVAKLGTSTYIGQKFIFSSRNNFAFYGQYFGVLISVFYLFPINWRFFYKDYDIFLIKRWLRTAFLKVNSN